jgi:hypothetical protein
MDRPGDRSLRRRGAPRNWTYRPTIRQPIPDHAPGSLPCSCGGRGLAVGRAASDTRCACPDGHKMLLRMAYGWPPGADG